MCGRFFCVCGAAFGSLRFGLRGGECGKLPVSGSGVCGRQCERPGARCGFFLWGLFGRGAGSRRRPRRGAEAGGHGVEQSVCGRLRCGKERIREEADAQRRSSFRCGRGCIGRGRCEERHDISERGGVTNGAAGCQNGRMCCQSGGRNLPKAGWHTD